MSKHVTPQMLKDINMDSRQVWPIRLFINKYETIPLRKSFPTLSRAKVEKALPLTIDDPRIITCEESHENRKAYLSEMLIQYDDKIWLYYDEYDDYTGGLTAVIFYCEQSDKIKLTELQDLLRACRQKDINNDRSMLILQLNRTGMPETTHFEPKKQKTNLVKNYNDALLPAYNILLKKLDSKKEGGLVLLYGNPGTGKTSFIRYLSSKIKARMILLQAEDFISIGKPQLTTILSNHPGSVLVIEDAETIVQKRDGRGDTRVASLLNLTDGLLTDYLNIKVICTFNSGLPLIDEALLRKGRLIVRHEFLPLETGKAQQLLRSLKCDFIPTGPMTLADIYHFAEENNFSGKKENTIGFR